MHEYKPTLSSYRSYLYLFQQNDSNNNNDDKIWKDVIIIHLTK